MSIALKNGTKLKQKSTELCMLFYNGEVEDLKAVAFEISSFSNPVSK